MTNWHVKCETCQQNDAVGVAAVPGIPYSAAYCDDCLRANAHPWWLLVGKQALIGEPFETTAPWWQDMVRATCTHLGKTIKQFKADVAQAAQDERRDMEERKCPHGYGTKQGPCPVCDAPKADFRRDE